MSDFKDKYKNAVDGLEISGDFKERAFTSMTNLRDSSDKKGVRSGIKITRTVSAIAAAAACFAVMFAISRNSTLSGDAEIESELLNETCVTKEVITEAAVLTEITAAETAVISETQSTDIPQTTAAETEEQLNENGIYTISEPLPETTLTVPEQTTAAAQTETASNENDVLVFEEALFVPPHDSEDIIPEADWDNDEAMEEDSAEECDDCYDEYEIIVTSSVINQTEETNSYRISARSVSEYYTENYITAEISIDDTTYNADNISLDEIFKEIYLCTEDKEPTILTEFSGEYELSLSLADNQGNILLIRAGKGFICFETNYFDEAAFYNYQLTDAEYEKLYGIFGRYAS